MAKKKVKQKVPSANAARRAAKANDEEQQARPGRQQDLIKDAFPERCDELEELAAKLVRLEDQAKKANEKKRGAKDEIAQAMIDAGLESYKCYTVRKELKRNVDSVKMRTIPEKESTPYTPA